MAIDENVEAIKGAAEGITYPILIDAEHLLTETYAISNVPTVIWIDEHNNIVQPNWSAFGTDTFVEFTGVESGPQKDLVRRWVTHNEPMMEPAAAAEAVHDLTHEEEQARLYFRIAAKLRRDGDEDGAERNFATAVEFAPHDWTIRRAAMPLRGKDPFGEDFMTMYGEWQEAGSPYHGVPSVRTR